MSKYVGTKIRDDIFTTHNPAVVSAELLLTNITILVYFSRLCKRAAVSQERVCVQKKNYKFF